MLWKRRIPLSKSSWENNRVGFDYFGSVGIALKHYVRFVLIYGKMWLGKTISNKTTPNKFVYFPELLLSLLTAARGAYALNKCVKHIWVQSE